MRSIGRWASILALCAAIVCLTTIRGAEKAIEGATAYAQDHASFSLLPAPKGAGVRVLCWNKEIPGQGPANVLVKPRRCSLYRDGHDFEAAGAAHLRKLEWKNWGAKTATGNGEYAEPMDIDDPWKPIRIKLKQWVDDCNGSVYSKVTFHTPDSGGGDGFPLWTCDD